MSKTCAHQYAFASSWSTASLAVSVYLRRTVFASRPKLRDSVYMNPYEPRRRVKLDANMHLVSTPRALLPTYT